MANPSNFEKYYKTISNSELLYILENPDEYQPLALEAAKKEFADRQLSETAIKEAMESLIEEKKLQENRDEKIAKVKNNIEGKINTLFETLNPIQSGIPNTERTIRAIVVALGFLFFYSIITNYGVITFFYHDFQISPFTTIFLLLPYILLFAAIITFWKRKRIGWTLLTIYLVFSLITLLWAMFIDFTGKSEFNFINNSFSPTSVITYITTAIFLIGILYTICRQNIREKFSANTQKAVVTICLTALFSLLSVMAIS